MPQSTRSAAFTLIELLVTIAVIGVLLAITLPVLSGVARRSRELACLANIREANTIATAWSLENRDLPPHFETSDRLTDELGIPLVTIPHLRFTANMNYFNQTRLWIRALRPPDQPVNRELTCAGTDSSLQSGRDPDDFASSSYDLSAALLAEASVFTPDTIDDYTPQQFRPQSLTLVSFPSAKSFLAEQAVYHIDGQPRNTLDLRVPEAPVSFVDGHASTESFLNIPMIRIPVDGQSPLPFSHTPRGVRGLDLIHNER